jgi:hypothetical protein
VTRGVAALPFRELPAVELLALDREGPDPDFDGYGWAKVDRLWLAGAYGVRRRLDDVLVIAAHAADDGAALADDVELDFAVAGELWRVSAAAFLAGWLPRLPPASTIVLAMCNPHRAVLARPPGSAASLHYASGDVVAWLDPGVRIRLSAEAWRRLDQVTTELTLRPGAPITDEDKQTYVGLYLLKKLDLKPQDGGLALPVVLPSELAPLDDVLQQLAVDDLVVINAKTGLWNLTKQGIAYLGEHIDEAAALIDEFDDDELEDVVAELRARNLDVFRARYLWAWYDGELDDLVLYQERRGVRPVERLWAYYLTSDALWNDLAREIAG